MHLAGETKPAGCRTVADYVNALDFPTPCAETLTRQQWEILHYLSYRIPGARRLVVSSLTRRGEPGVHGAGMAVDLTAPVEDGRENWSLVYQVFLHLLKNRTAFMVPRFPGRVFLGLPPAARHLHLDTGAGEGIPFGFETSRTPGAELARNEAGFVITLDRSGNRMPGFDALLDRAAQVYDTGDPNPNPLNEITGWLKAAVVIGGIAAAAWLLSEANATAELAGVGKRNGRRG